MSKNTEPKVLTRKHLARAEKEHRQQLILIWCIIGFVVVVFGLIAYGFIDQYLINPQKAVAIVDGQTITVKDYKAFGTLDRIQRINSYRQLYQYASMYQQFGLSVDESLQQQMNQIASELSTPQSFGQNVLTTMINNVILKNQAAKMGITVSPDEVTKTIQESYGFFINGTATPANTPTSYAFPTYSKTQEFLLITRTPTVNLTPTTTLMPTTTSTTRPTPSTQYTSNPTTEPTSTSIISPTSEPTATPYTLEGFQAGYNAYIKNLSTFGVTEADLTNYVTTQLLNMKITTEVIKNVPTHGEQVWIRHILSSTDLEAQAVVARISNGENWIAVASEVSQDETTKTNGGELGWFPKGILSAEMDNVVFQMSLGQIQVVEDSAGWHVIQLLGKESDRPFSQSILYNLQNSAYTEWFIPLKDATKIETFNTWINNVPISPVLSTQTVQ